MQGNGGLVFSTVEAESGRLLCVVETFLLMVWVAPFLLVLGTRRFLTTKLVFAAFILLNKVVSFLPLPELIFRNIHFFFHFFIAKR